MVKLTQNLFWGFLERADRVKILVEVFGDCCKNDVSMGQIWDFMVMEDISRDKIATEVTLYK